jgi:hypothetical protein
MNEFTELEIPSRTSKGAGRPALNVKQGGAYFFGRDEASLLKLSLKAARLRSESLAEMVIG